MVPAGELRAVEEALEYTYKRLLFSREAQKRRVSSAATRYIPLSLSTPMTVMYSPRDFPVRLALAERLHD